MKQTLPILMVDDEVEAIQSIEIMLHSCGLSSCFGCQDSRQVMSILQQREIGVILLDLRLPHISGEELLRQISKDHPYIPVIIISGANNLEVAIECMKQGAFDYLVKPVEITRFKASVTRAVELRELKIEYNSFKNKVFSNHLDRPDAFASIITSNSMMFSLFKYVETIAQTSKAVLITGESGVGKELVARAIHRLSNVAGQFVAINVAGFDENLFSDSLFGHTRGAFTGATTYRAGLIEKASDGTILLDEIGDLNSANQIKLLRLIQEGEYFPLGSDVPKESTARIVSSTNIDRHLLQEEGRFRKDLFYRLQACHIHIPPLRERIGDLPILVEHFIDLSATTLGIEKPIPPEDIYPLLATYHFPGNIRELESMIFSAMSVHGPASFSMDHIRTYIQKHNKTVPEYARLTDDGVSPFSMFSILPSYKRTTLLLIQEALRRTAGNKSAAARLLGMSRAGFKKALQRLA